MYLSGRFLLKIAPRGLKDAMPFAVHDVFWLLGAVLDSAGAVCCDPELGLVWGWL